MDFLPIQNRERATLALTTCSSSLWTTSSSVVVSTHTHTRDINVHSTSVHGLKPAVPAGALDAKWLRLGSAGDRRFDFRGSIGFLHAHRHTNTHTHVRIQQDAIGGVFWARTSTTGFVRNARGENTTNETRRRRCKRREFVELPALAVAHRNSRPAAAAQRQHARTLQTHRHASHIRASIAQPHMRCGCVVVWCRIAGRPVARRRRRLHAAQLAR